MSWVRVPPEQLFFIFYGKRDVQVSYIASFIYVGLTVSIQYMNIQYMQYVLYDISYLAYVILNGSMYLSYIILSHSL